MSKYQAAKRHEAHGCEGHSAGQCAPVPEFERLNFFHGQMLAAADFRAEQDYFREKHKLQNRCLHGWAVVCGLQVTPAPSDPICLPASDEERRRIKRALERIEAGIEEIEKRLQSELSDEEAATLKARAEELAAEREDLRRRLEDLGPCHEHADPCCDDRNRIGVTIDCGVALDCCGDEIVVRNKLEVNLWSLLSPTDRRRLLECRSGEIYVSLCYCAEPTYPSRPVVPDSCGALSDCSFGRTRDSFRMEAALDAPKPDLRCDTCCEPCETPCVLIAKVTWDAGDDDHPIQVDDSVRRMLSRDHPTTITGKSWVHGGVYDSDQAKQVLGTETPGDRSYGLEVLFSGPVRKETLQQCVVEIQRTQGGRGLRGVISHIEGSFVNLDPDGDGCVDRFFFRDDSGETLNSDDKVLIIVRADFILDKCCRPIDGNHVGGRVPLLAGYEPPRTGDDGVAIDAEKPRYLNEYRDYAEGGKNYDAEPPKPKKPRKVPCLVPPDGTGVWRSGNGTPGGVFESWFFIK